jgi:hypothetical protein
LLDRASIFLLIGFPGTGKYTVANALQRRLIETGRQTRLVDNHYVNNPIFGLLDVDGIKRLPEGTWDRVGEVRNAIVATVESLSPREWSFIFTNHLIERPAEREWVERLQTLALAREALFVPVRLLCEPGELRRRIASPERKARMKMIDPEEIERMVAAEVVLDPHLADTLTLDVTTMPPTEAADRIVTHLKSLADMER